MDLRAGHGAVVVLPQGRGSARPPPPAPDPFLGTDDAGSGRQPPARPHVGRLAARLGLPRPDLPGRLAAAGARVSVFWHDEAVDRERHLADGLRQALEASGAALEIVEYPQPVTLRGEGGDTDAWA